MKRNDLSDNSVDPLGGPGQLDRLEAGLSENPAAPANDINPPSGGPPLVFDSCPGGIKAPWNTSAGVRQPGASRLLSEAKGTAASRRTGVNSWSCSSVEWVRRLPCLVWKRVLPTAQNGLQATQPQLKDGSVHHARWWTDGVGERDRWGIVYTGPVLTNHQLLQQVWGPDKTGGSGSVRDIIKRLRRKLGDDANNPAYILNEPRVGYWMEKGETRGLGEP